MSTRLHAMLGAFRLHTHELSVCHGPHLHATLFCTLRLCQGGEIALSMPSTSPYTCSALIFGAIFYRMGRSQSSIQDRLGLLQVSAINTAMSSLVKTIGVSF